MQLRSRPVVFVIATALGAGLAVPGALALTSSAPAPATTKTTATSVEEQHEAQAADHHEADRSELGAAGAGDDRTAATDHKAANATAHGAAPAHGTEAADEPTDPKIPGATGDEHRSDEADEHSQGDEHRAVAPGVPAHKAGDQSGTDHPDGATTAEQHHSSHDSGD